MSPLTTGWIEADLSPSQPDKGQLPKAGVLGPSLISSITRHEKGTAVVTSKFCPFDHTKQDYGESWNLHKAEWREGIQLESCRHDAKNNLFMTAVHSHVSVAWIVSNANLKISHPARAAHLFKKITSKKLRRFAGFLRRFAGFLRRFNFHVFCKNWSITLRLVWSKPELANLRRNVHSWNYYS